MTCALETQKLGMVFRTNWGTKKRALEGLDLQVDTKEIFGFLGHNGAGKTTTIKILMGICRPTEGKASILGIPIQEIKARRHIGFLPENISFYEYLTGLETVEFIGRLRGLGRKECRRRGPAILEEVGLKDAAGRRVSEYSKGMRQRLGLAQAMIHDPEVLILDEPLSGLDPSGRREVREKIRILGERGKTVFFSSHVLSDVEMLCDRVALLTRGRMTAIGTLDSLLGSRIKAIELVGEGFGEKALLEIETFCRRIHREEGKTAVWVDREEDSQRVQRLLAESGGRLKALIPHRESLEDYYFRLESLEKGGAN